MSAIPKRKLTPEEYLEIERRAEYKSEYFDGEIFAMAGAKRRHNRNKEEFQEIRLSNPRGLQYPGCTSLQCQIPPRICKPSHD